MAKSEVSFTSRISKAKKNHHKGGSIIDRKKLVLISLAFLFSLLFTLFASLELRNPGLFLSIPIAYAFPVPDLPPDNLVVNPWFRSAEDTSSSGLDGWTVLLENGIGWGLSQKESNPSPGIVISGKCSFEPVFCGTAARWASKNGVLYPGMDAYFYQVVKSNIAHRRLKFFTHWVTHRVEVAEVTIYGSGSPDGPWNKLWVPFFHTQDTNPPPPPGGAGELWKDTGYLEWIASEGHSYYKVEVHGRYPEANAEQGDVGFKITGIYFSVQPLTSYNYLPILNR